ncbi:MAG: YheU family protein [Kangiellaceae bacterium]|nr:YheU family protein [Kangiellaceae bacterium]
MLISYTELSDDVLESISKEWVISKLSDSESHPMVNQWAKETLIKIKSGDLIIEFGEETQTVYLKTKEEIEYQAEEENNE